MLSHRYMLKITIHDSARELRFKLEGRLCGAWVKELRQCWQTAISTTEGRQTVLDLLEVDFVDQDGQALMADMSRRGVSLLAVSPLIRSLIEEIASTPGCGTVEEKPARRIDAFASVITSGRDPRTL
jgi:anti-anti-sigma regulatory factor